MTGRIITCKEQLYDLPELLAWTVSYTGSVPCDCYSVSFPYQPDMAEPLRLAAGFRVIQDNQLLLQGIVDEYEISLSHNGLVASVSGRGYAARLLDNESRPITYEGATLAEIIQNHVTPYGIHCAEIASVSSNSIYTVAAGSSQWKALDNFCRTYGGFSPHFRRDGQLIAAPESNTGQHFFIGPDTPILNCSLHEDHYGVFTEVLVIDKTRNASYSVKNYDWIARGGQCRRVLYTPGQSTWAAMRYTGEYQINRSREEEKTITVRLPGAFPAFPGDIVQIDLPRLGLSGDFRVAEAENQFSASTGSTVTLTLREPL